MEEKKTTTQVKSEPIASKESTKPPTTPSTKQSQQPVASKKPTIQHSTSTTGSTTVATSSYEFMRKLTFANEPKLQPDSSKQFKLVVFCFFLFLI